MSDKKKVLVIFGGQSGEHEISVVSANSIIKALDTVKYEILTIGITKDGRWFWGVMPEEWIEAKEQIKPEHIQVTLVLEPMNPRFISLNGSQLKNEGKCDIVFPVMHGPKGEDGTIQGLMEVAGFPYVGSGVLGSALGMDKDRMKAVFKDAGLPIVPHITVLRSELAVQKKEIAEKITQQLGFPCFVKPANLGSSVGISKAKDREELISALDYAAEFDRKIVIEKGVKAREIELSVLGNDDAKASIPGEIIPSKDFYDYEAKYIDTGSKLIIPAELNDSTVKQLQEYAVKAFHSVEAFGLSRMDFFVTEDGSIYANEINTMPGFTQISMYPKLWEASGVPYKELLDHLINLGLENFKDNTNKKLS